MHALTSPRRRCLRLRPKTNIEAVPLSLILPYAFRWNITMHIKQQMYNEAASLGNRSIDWHPQHCQICLQAMLSNCTSTSPHLVNLSHIPWTLLHLDPHILWTPAPLRPIPITLLFWSLFQEYDHLVLLNSIRGRKLRSGYSCVLNVNSFRRDLPKSLISSSFN